MRSARISDDSSVEMGRYAERYGTDTALVLTLTR